MRNIKRKEDADRPELGWTPNNYSKPHESRKSAKKNKGDKNKDTSKKN